MDFMKKYKCFLFYIAFGVMTTFVNIVVYYICMNIFAAGNILSNIIAWGFSVSFAYFTNRKWVFESEAKDSKGLVREAIYFYSCRLLTGFLDLVIMFIFVDLIHFNYMVMKFLSNVIVILSNFIASKFIVFKKTRIMEI